MPSTGPRRCVKILSKRLRPSLFGGIALTASPMDRKRDGYEECAGLATKRLILGGLKNQSNPSGGDLSLSSTLNSLVTRKTSMKAKGKKIVSTRRSVSTRLPGKLGNNSGGGGGNAPLQNVKFSSTLMEGAVGDHLPPPDDHHENLVLELSWLWSSHDNLSSHTGGAAIPTQDLLPCQNQDLGDQEASASYGVW